MDTKEAAITDAAAPTDADTAPSGGSVARRRVLSVGIAGATASLLPFLGRRADATKAEPATAGTGAGTGNSNGPTGASIPPNNGYNATGDSTNASAAGTVGVTAASSPTSDATTTTAPPKRPTKDDIALMAFGQSMELTIRDLYDVAIGAGTFTGATLEAIRAIRDAHAAYGQSISGLLGRDAPNARIDKLFTSLQKSFTGKEADIAAAAQALENTAVATHTEAVGNLVGIDGSALVASLMIVEARHATYLAMLAGAATLDAELASTAFALSPSDYPAK